MKAIGAITSPAHAFAPTRLSVLACVVFWAVPALAATPEEKVVFKKRTLVDLSEVSIRGELRKPEADFYGSRKRTRFNKLIRVRANFEREVVSSADNL